VKFDVNVAKSLYPKIKKELENKRLGNIIDIKKKEDLEENSSKLCNAVIFCFSILSESRYELFVSFKSKFMLPIYAKLSLSHQNVKFFKIDSDSFPSFCEKFQVMSLPCFIIFDKEGNEMDRFEGANENDLLQLINKI
jgi:thiol-disulfide isomerase/thioredoxin